MPQMVDPTCGIGLHPEGRGCEPLTAHHPGCRAPFSELPARLSVSLRQMSRSLDLQAAHEEP